MLDPVFRLDIETDHSCLYLFILICLYQLNIFAFGDNKLICPYLLGSLAYSSVIYLHILLSSGEPGLLYFMYIFIDYISIKRPVSNLALLLG